MSGGNQLTTAAIAAAVGLVFSLGFLLLGREIVCWYWKINQMTQLLEAIHLELKTKNSIGAKESNGP